MHVELGWRELTNPPAVSVPREPVNSAPRGVTPPRLYAVDPEATQITPRVIAATVRLDGALVNQHAEAEVAAARAAGAPNSLRVWRESHQRALLALTREAVRAPAGARCEAITWEQAGDAYQVTASFTAVPVH